ncbi:hypothetical protein PM082_018134 [Marasmius tenuissimus]|nr:hypothetical protein PM082_018134 [Marasmius tenuissimus]
MSANITSWPTSTGDESSAEQGNGTVPIVLAIALVFLLVLSIVPMRHWRSRQPPKRSAGVYYDLFLLRLSSAHAFIQAGGSGTVQFVRNEDPERATSQQQRPRPRTWSLTQSLRSEPPCIMEAPQGAHETDGEPRSVATEAAKTAGDGE